MLLQQLKQKKLRFRNIFCPDKHLCFLAGKSHSTLLWGWLRDTGYPICYDLPLFATIRHYSRLFATICTIRDYSHYLCYLLFAIRDCSLFAIRDYSLFAIRVFQTPHRLPFFLIAFRLYVRRFQMSLERLSFVKTLVIFGIIYATNPLLQYMTKIVCLRWLTF